MLNLNSAHNLMTYRRSVCLDNMLSDSNEIQQLLTLAVKGLVFMFEPEKQLFCFTAKRTDHGIVREGVSLRYSIIAALGLYRLETTGISSPIELRPLLDNWIQNRMEDSNIGDRGLMLWLCSLISPDRLEEIYSRLLSPSVLSRCREIQSRRTMELAWLLSGLAHAASIPGPRLPGISDLAANIYKLLEGNQGPEGVFGHMSNKASLAGALRGQIGSFADQVYPIYAFAKFGRILEVPAALKRAQRCAEAICRAQGRFGEWWWHYQSDTGRVVRPYPVYSTHQHGMAPMALFAVGEATQVDFGEPIHKGLAWINGQNELRVDLRANSDGVVWRNLYPANKSLTNLLDAAKFLGVPVTGSSKNLRINFECRPYELGWLLYAFADRQAGSALHRC